ncbi:malate dehydrogenase, mitochondrial, partial [Haematococcus lacustris]
TPTYEYTYVESSVTESPFFASKVKLSTEGVEKVYDLGTLSDYEKAALKTMMPELLQSVEKGVEFVKNS